MKAEISIEKLVQMIMLALTIAVVITIGTYFGIVANNSNANECATSVQAAMQAARLGPETKLVGCDTRTFTITADTDEDDLREQFIEDYEWCERSFQPLRNDELFNAEGTFCHVCALYVSEAPLRVGGIVKELSASKQSPEDIRELFPGMTIEDADDVEFNFNSDTAIMYIQTKDYKSFLAGLHDKPELAGASGAALGGLSGYAVGKGVALTIATITTGGAGTLIVVTGVAVGATIAGAGSYLGSIAWDPALDLHSGIYITAYDAAQFDAMGCNIQDISRS